MKPIVKEFSQLEVGQKASFVFTVSKTDMLKFKELSGDSSRIHHDKYFAKKNGFKEPVVYGAMSVAYLSKMVGMLLPGDLGLATDWKVQFHKPIYCNQDNVFSAEIIHKSEATKTVRIKFSINHNNTLLASGLAGSQILEQ